MSLHNLKIAGGPTTDDLEVSLDGKKLEGLTRISLDFQPQRQIEVTISLLVRTELDLTVSLQKDADDG